MSKLVVALGVTGFASFLLAAMLVWVVMDERGTTRQIDNLRTQSALIERINGVVYAVVMESRGVYMSEKPDVLERYAKNLETQLAELGKAVEAWSALVGDEDRSDFATFSASYKTFDALRRDLAQAGRSKGSAAARVIGDNDANRTVRIAFNNAIKVLAERYKERAERLYARSEGRAGLVLGLAIALAGLAAIVSLSSIHFVRRHVAGPVTRLTEAVRKLAAGDTEIDLPKLRRQDEIGTMTAAVTIFRENTIARLRLEHETRANLDIQQARASHLESAISGFEQSVGGIVQTVASASTQIDAASRSLNLTTMEAVAMTTTISAATTQAAMSVQAVAAATNELSQSIGEITGRVGSSGSIAENAVAEAKTTAGHFAALTNAANRIGTVLQIITGIAEQTNLLALNATIEAARAGDSGRGFAVVAAEVKTLAQQTAAATQDIAAQIDAMQSAMGNVGNALESIGDTIVKVRDNGSAIATAIEEQSFATAEISKNVQEAAKGTEDVSRNLVGITDATDATNAASSQLTAMAHDLAKQAGLLRERMAGFIETVRAA